MAPTSRSRLYQWWMRTFRPNAWIHMLRADTASRIIELGIDSIGPIDESHGSRLYGDSYWADRCCDVLEKIKAGGPGKYTVDARTFWNTGLRDMLTSQSVSHSDGYAGSIGGAEIYIT